MILGIALFVGVVLAPAGAPVVSAAPSTVCKAPCLDAARGARRDCVSSAIGAFQFLLDECLPRDRVCLDVCRMEQQDCRDATGLAETRAECAQRAETVKEVCNERFLPGSRRWRRCVFTAEIQDYRCRRQASRAVRGALRECRRAFRGCVAGCGPGAPPAGVEACRAAADDVRRALLGECRVAFRLAVGACIDGDAS